MSTKNQEVYRDVLTMIHKTLPKFRVVAKQKSRLHRFIGWTLRFPWIFGWNINRQYMDLYWTTIGQTTAYPKSLEDPADSWATILHEQRHGHQAKRYNVAFGPLYLLGTPVYAVALGLITALCTPLWIWVMPWWISLIMVGLGLVLSIPVPFGRFRATCEYDGYGVTLALEHWLNGSVAQSTIDWIANEFITSAYFWMHPNKPEVVKRLNQIDQQVLDGTIFKDPTMGQQYWDIYQILVRHELTTVEYA